MTVEEYALLRSIAAADCTEGPNFDPALLTELLDIYDGFYIAHAALRKIAEGSLTVAAPPDVVSAVRLVCSIANDALSRIGR